MEDKPKLQIEMRFFARAAELLGVRTKMVLVDDGVRVAEVIEQFSASELDRCPEIENLLRVSRWALDTEFCDRDTIIDRACVLAMIPPVSGG